MFRAVVEEAAALASITLFLGMIAVWAQVIVGDVTGVIFACFGCVCSVAYVLVLRSPNRSSYPSAAGIHVPTPIPDRTWMASEAGLARLPSHDGGPPC